MPPNTPLSSAGFPPVVVPKQASSVSKGKVYTWQEVAEHNTAESCWVYAGNKVYDITNWLDRHPGGKEMLLLAGGRDVTDMLTSYHPFTDKPQEILAKYEIGTITSTEFPQCPPDSGFYRTVRARVGDYFKKNNLDPKSPYAGLLRLAGILAVAYFAWITSLDTQQLMVVRVLCAVVAGHDSSHTSIGGKEVWWKVIGRFCMDWYAGASMSSWHHQHVVGHHVYTNILGADPDMPVFKKGDLRRVTSLQDWAASYKLQHWYLMFLYGFLGIKFRVQDIQGILTQSNGPIRTNFDPKKELMYQVVVKACWTVWRILLPLLVWKVPLVEFALLTLLTEMSTGWYLAFNFQVSHISPSAIFPDMDHKLKNEWAVMQVLTGVDYGHGDPFMTFMSGALNYQIVHHLFPGVSQYHYPAIAPVIKKTCEEFKIPYCHLPDFKTAFYMHWKHLKDLGDGAHVHAH